MDHFSEANTGPVEVEVVAQAVLPPYQLLAAPVALEVVEDG